ncbi:MAG TPA: alpha/beta hydrolase-fold protein [Gaiellaceae bacterium]|nr:alpha/beta hydrolase-fold protein [Gaiellaceae bacterium]
MRASLALRALALVAVIPLILSVQAASATAPSDDFNRPDGSLGSNWAAIGDGGLSISSQALVGTSATAGDIRVAESYGSDQSSQIELTQTQLTGGQWVGPAVRAQNGGQDTYLGIYFWNNGSQQLRLYKRNGGNWTQLGSSYASGPLPAGTKLQLSAVGSTISFLQDGVSRISASDSSISGGAPAIMTYGQATADNWTGGAATGGTGNPGFSVTYRSTDANGVASYDVTAAENGYGTQTLRVLAPTHPAAGVPHSFLYVLPVEAGLGSTYGDGIATLASLDAEDQYNLTIVEPSFGIEPWYADNPNDSNLRYETFMTNDLVPWVRQNLSTTGHEQNWLIGFSKSGIGGQDLLLKHPEVYSLAASWDFPADMSSYDQFGSSSANEYGTDANFQANYRLTPIFVQAHALALVGTNRIWIGGYQAFQGDMTDYDALLSSQGIQHTTETPTYMPHRWDSGWVPIALAALRQDSQNLPASP